jgi:hypothetical protein
LSEEKERKLNVKEEEKEKKRLAKACYFDVISLWISFTDINVKRFCGLASANKFLL